MRSFFPPGFLRALVRVQCSDRYGAESFPGITQALRDGDETLARAQVAVASGCINDAADFLSGGSGVGAQGAVEPGAAGPTEP